MLNKSPLPIVFRRNRSPERERLQTRGKNCALLSAEPDVWLLQGLVQVVGVAASLAAPQIHNQKEKEMKNQHRPVLKFLSPERQRWLLAGTGLLLALVTSRADVEVSRRWASTAPVIDGTVSPGEWTSATATPIGHGQMRTMNDGSYLYVLLDVVDDTVADDDLTGYFSGDFFTLDIDKDLNYAVTPNVDFTYGCCQDGRTFVKSIRLNQYTSTGCQPVNPNSLGARGFGPTFNSATPHRFWEFRLSFDELGVDPTTWTTSAGSIPKVRMNVCIFSLNPNFTSCQPDATFAPDNSNMYQVDLAIWPSFPPGSTGPIFAGVGLVPFNYIDTAGYANINISGYYYATNAPFGANLNIFGSWNTLRFAYGAARYRVLYSKNGGPYTRLKQTWTNFKFNGLVWVPNAIGPDANDSYPIPSPWEVWFLPNLLITWQTAVGFSDGTYNLKLELLNSSGFVLASPPGNSLTLFIDNTPPLPIINNAFYDGTAVCECGTVTQGPCFIFPVFHGFTFDVTVNDPNGALSSYSLGYTYGNNHNGGIFGDAYTSGHVNQDGPEKWNGVTNNIVPPFPPFCAPATCAYTFILSATSRVQNGYGPVFPYVDYKKSLTILLGTAGAINCP